MTKPLGWRYRLMIGILAFTAYAPTLKTGFLWDDYVVIERNPWIQQWSLEAFRHDFTSDVFDGQGDAYYRPLTTVLNRVDYALWGMQPWGFHLTNLLIHLGNALLIAELILVLGFMPLAAFLTASLFAVHPIGVEQFLVVAGRAELMGLFFPLLSVLLLLRKSRRALLAGWLAFIAGLFSKESAVMTPLILTLVYAIRKEPRERYARVGLLIFSILPYLALRQSIVGAMIAEPNGELTLRFFIQEFPSVIVRYTGLLLVPWNLYSHRFLPHISHFWLVYLLGCVGAAAFLIRRFGRPAIFSIGWFLLTLLPKTPAMIYGNFMLDHWAYPAALGLCFPMALVVEKGWTWRSKGPRTASGMAYFSFVIVWSLLVHLNVALRGTNEKMYRWALHFTSSKPVKYNLGALLLQTGRPREAIIYLADFRENYPEDPRSVRLLSAAYWAAGRPRAAIRLLESYIRTYPGHPDVAAQLQGMQRDLPTALKTR